jgi:hypothetical protein
MRQIHHWTALVFIAVVVLHLSRVFFTGAFRRPRAPRARPPPAGAARRFGPAAAGHP